MQKVEEEKVVYVPFADIANPGYAPDQLPAVFGKVAEFVRFDLWKNNYEGLEQLRVLNKFYFDFLCPRLDSIDESIKRLLDSLRSGILKLTLLFMQELAGGNLAPEVPRGEPLKLYLPKVIPSLFVKLLDAKKFIVKEAELALKNVVTYSISSEVVNTICEQCFINGVKNTQWSDNVMPYLETSIMMYGNKELLLFTKEKLFPVLSCAVDTGRKVMLRKTASILAELRKNVGSELLEGEIKTSGIGERDIKKLLEIVEGKELQAKKPEAGIKAYIQAMKEHKP